MWGGGGGGGSSLLASIAAEKINESDMLPQQTSIILGRIGSSTLITKEIETAEELKSS